VHGLCRVAVVCVEAGRHAASRLAGSRDARKFTRKPRGAALAVSGRMIPGRAAGCLVLTTLLAAPLASAAPKAKARGASRPDAPVVTTQSHAAVATEALQRHVTEAGLTDSLARYVITPSVVQLRRYVEAKRLRLVCVVDLALRDERGTLLATVRGNAIAVGASPHEAIDSATHAAVVRLPEALQALRPTPTSPSLAQARRQWEVPLK
jgi:hypothetical protein